MIKENVESLKDEVIYGDDRELLDNDFKRKYGFSIIELEEKLEEKGIDDTFMCYSVKELAYTIVDKFYSILYNENYNGDYFIDYKLIPLKDNKDYIHRTAFYYNDIVFVVDIKWIGNVLKVIDWDIVTCDNFEKLKGFEDIESVLDDEED